ncbi:type IV pilin N-terminal domain-containing protein [Methanoregula sp.]|jgi:hypothetical protein|uniref:type IV pilin N-terminal domain-containing protein n=1 Tax=Methanoregula sp. TaxID=2052170 RepID=UPI0025D71517|nr:type IV pilin N-terminal domain-containing protein [Methanoregula sp.]
MNKDAASMVTGVILVVAITIILAAILAVFVFSMAGNLQKTKRVAATASKPSLNEIIVTYEGGQDAATFSYGLVTVIPPGGIFYQPDHFIGPRAFPVLTGQYARYLKPGFCLIGQTREPGKNGGTFARKKNVCGAFCRQQRLYTHPRNIPDHAIHNRP